MPNVSPNQIPRSSDSPSRQEIESRKANLRVKAFIGGGSRPALVSRAVVGAILLTISLLLWVARAVAVPF